MTRLQATLAVLTMLCVTSSSAFAQTRALPSSRDLARFGLERAWHGQATLDVRQDRVRHVVLDEQSFYVQSSGGIITAFDSETGQKRWAVQLGRQNTPSQACVSNEDKVLAIVGTTLYALDKIDGELIWKLSLPNSASTSPTVDSRRLYYGTLDGSVYAYDLKKIEELHNDNLLPQWTNVALLWRYKAADEITTQAISNNLTLLFASRDKSLYSLTAADRTLQWQFETDRAVSAPLGHSPGFVYLASEDFNVFCIKQDTGSMRWQFVAGLPIKKEVRVIGNNCYIFPHRGGVFCISKISGERRWKKPYMEDFIGATKKLVFLTDNLGQVSIMASDDGAPIGSLKLHNFKIRYGNELTDRLYMATESGLIMCLREQNKEFPTYHMYPEREPILPEFASDEAVADDADASAAADADNDSNDSGFNF